MVIGLWVIVTKRVSVRLRIASRRSQKRSTLESSSGASTSSSTQIGEGLVRNTAKISDSAVSACSPPDSSVMRLRLLAGRAREDFETGLERIVGFDQLQLGRSASEQRREQLAEMLIDDLERAEQPFAALAC